MNTPQEGSIADQNTPAYPATPEQVASTLETGDIAEFMKDVDVIQLLIGERASHL